MVPSPLLGFGGTWTSLFPGPGLSSVGLPLAVFPRALWLAKRQAQSRIYRLQVPKVLGTMQRPGTLNILNQPLNEQPH